MSELLQHILCPMSCEKIEYPIIASDGFTYEESFFESWITTSTRSPMIGTTLSSTNFVKNKSIAYFTNCYDYYAASYSKHKPKVINPLPTTLKHKLGKLMVDYFQLAQPLSIIYSSFESLQKEFPEEEIVTLEYANTMRFGCVKKKALELIEEVKSESSLFVIAKYMKARLIGLKNPLHGKGLIEEVQRVYSIADHTLLEIRYLASAVLFLKNKLEGLKVINAYVELCPNDMRAFLNQVYAFHYSKNTEKVLEYGKKFLERYKYDACVSFYMAKAYAVLKNKVEAHKYFDMVIDKSKDPMFSSECYYGKAMLRDEETEFNEKVSELIKANELFPKIIADLALANLYKDKRQYTEANKWLEIYGSRVNKETDISYYRVKAGIKEAMGDRQEAIRCYTFLIENDGAYAGYYNMKINELQ